MCQPYIYLYLYLKEISLLIFSLMRSLAQLCFSGCE